MAGLMRMRPGMAGAVTPVAAAVQTRTQVPMPIQPITDGDAGQVDIQTLIAGPMLIQPVRAAGVQELQIQILVPTLTHPDKGAAGPA